MRTHRSRGPRITQRWNSIGWPGLEPHGREALEEHLDRRLEFAPGEMRPQTEVLAMTERKVLVVVGSVWIEAMRIGEDLRVAVRGVNAE